jgi:hypothetical protein
MQTGMPLCWLPHLPLFGHSPIVWRASEGERRAMNTPTLGGLETWKKTHPLGAAWDTEERRAVELFERPKAAQKRELIAFVFSNLRLKGKKLEFSHVSQIRGSVS